MRLALQEAQRAGSRGETPVGALIAKGGEVVATAGNRREQSNDPTAHAEILAIRQAAAALGSWRLGGCSIYVTIEPCPMCAGAIYQARLDHLVYGAADEKAGAAGTLLDLVRNPKLNHRLEVTAGVLAEEAAALLRDFFGVRR